MRKTVKVLIVDDSAYMRVVLKDMLSVEDGLTVVGTAKDGMEAIEKTKALKPDVVLLDIQMPKMDGLATLQRIMKESPTRVIMLSAMDKVDVDLPLKALAMGAVEFISKPGGPISVDIVKYRAHIARTVHDVSGARIDVLQKARAPLEVDGERLKPKEVQEKRLKAIVIAASTGGPRAVEYVFSRLPRDIPAVIFVVQHLPVMFSASFAKRLDKVKGPKTLVASDGDHAREGHAYIAPGGFHLRVKECSKSRAHLLLDRDTPPVQFVKPSADVLFDSASKCFGDRVLAVILTGMGMDGVNGAKAVKSAGGKVIVQDEKSSVIYGMPKAAADAGVADKNISLEDIPEEIVRFLED